MSITAMRNVLTASGATPTGYSQRDLLQQMITTAGGTPTQVTITGLLRQLITALGGTPTQYNDIYLLRELVTAAGGTPASFDPDLLFGQLAVTGLGRATFSAPPDQTLFTQNSANTITTAKAAPVTADGVSIGSTSGSPATLSYTPTVADNDQTLATADDTRKIGVYPADLSQLTNPAQWVSGDGSMTKTTGAPDPWGGTTGIKFTAINSASSRQYKCEGYAVSAPTTTPNAGLEFWFSPEGTLLPKLYVYPGTTGCNVATDTRGHQAFGSLSIYPVEKKTVSGRRWIRYLVRGEVGQTIGSPIYFTFSNNMDPFGSYATVVNSGTHGGIFAGTRFVDGVVPLYKWQRANFSWTGSAYAGSSTARRYIWHGPFNDGDTAQDGGNSFNCDVLLPTTYNANRATPYNCVILLPVEQDVNVYNGEITGNGNGSGGTYPNQGAYHQGLHDSLDTIFVRPTVHGWSYGGVHSTGIFDHKTFYGEAVPAFLRDEFNIGKIALSGYSKAALAGLYLIQSYPNTFDCVGLIDGPFGKAYNSPNYGEVEVFGNQATYDAYEPLTNFTARKAPLLTRKRIVLGPSTAFVSNMASLKSALDSAGVAYSNRTALSMPVHDYLASYGNTVAADLVAMMNGTLT